MELLYCSYCRKSTGWEFFVPAQTHTPYRFFWRFRQKLYLNTNVQRWCFLINKLVSVTPQTHNTRRKLRSSAFQRYQGLGVADRVFEVKYWVPHWRSDRSFYCFGGAHQKYWGSKNNGSKNNSQKTPPTWLPPPTIANSHHCPPRFRHAETTVKGTEMGYRNFLQPPQQANTDTCHYIANK